ncbi:hypothetical protein ME121_3715 [Methylobacterium sp. ME121]|jgi:hypothetical protein|nr:hypothetical protein ME121_3715 [Methylobacterium sp. ME121]
MWLRNWVRDLRYRFVADSERLEAAAYRDSLRVREIERQRQSAELNGEMADLEKRLSPRDLAQR